MARFIEKNEAQLMKNSRNMVPSTLTALVPSTLKAMVPSTLTALRSVCTDLSEPIPKLMSPKLSPPELNPVDRRRREDTSSPVARRNDELWRRTSDLNRSWNVESAAAAVAESTESHVPDTVLARLMRRI